jgi:hypothetical protein
MLTTRTRRIIAEVLDHIVQRDIDSRGIRETYNPENLTMHADVLSDFADAMRLDHDGDDVSLAESAVDAVAIDEDGRHGLRARQ